MSSAESSNGHPLAGRRVAILTANGFEQVELTQPKKALEQAGAECLIVSPEKDQVKGWNFTDWGISLPVDIPLDEADPDYFDALMLPGGVMNPDKLRINPKAIKFVRAFFDEAKPVGAICHAPWTLIEAGQVDGRQMTSYWSIETDLKNAGAKWVDRDVVIDNGLVTSRSPDDLPVFCSTLIAEIQALAQTF